jgi:hypothetical protein
MRIIALVLVIMGLLATLAGLFSFFGAMPTVVQTIESLGPENSTAAFWWVLALLFFFASHAFSSIARAAKP